MHDCLRLLLSNHVTLNVAPRTLVETGPCRRCSIPKPACCGRRTVQNEGYDQTGHTTPFRATVDTSALVEARRRSRAVTCSTPLAAGDRPPPQLPGKSPPRLPESARIRTTEEQQTHRAREQPLQPLLQPPAMAAQLRLQPGGSRRDRPARRRRGRRRSTPRRRRTRPVSRRRAPARRPVCLRPVSAVVAAAAPVRTPRQLPAEPERHPSLTSNTTRGNDAGVWNGHKADGTFARVFAGTRSGT